MIVTGEPLLLVIILRVIPIVLPDSIKRSTSPDHPTISPTVLPSVTEIVWYLACLLELLGIGAANLSSHWGPLYLPFRVLFNDYRPPHFPTGRTLKSCEYHWNVRGVGPQTATPLLVPYSSPSILNSDEHWITPSLQFRFQRTLSERFLIDFTNIRWIFHITKSLSEIFILFFSKKLRDIFYFFLSYCSTNIRWEFLTTKFLLRFLYT